MSAKTIRKRARGKKIPNLIDVGGILARPDDGILAYNPPKRGKGSFFYQDIRLMMHLSKTGLGFSFILGDTGLSFSFRLENEKEVKAFVDFVQQAYEMAK